MNRTKTSLERAFELAASGKIRTIEELRLMLKGEGYSLTHLTGASLTKQLRDLMRAHQSSKRT